MYPLLNFLSDDMSFKKVKLGTSKQVLKRFQMPAVLEIKPFPSSSEQQVEKKDNGKIQ